MAVWVIFGLFTVLLAAPRLGKEQSWGEFLKALPIAFFGVIVPLFVFLLSTFLVPDWKGGCRYGWIDCFHQGKLALTPLVLWATFSLYAVDVYRISRPLPAWVALGLFAGAIVAPVCFIHGIFATGDNNASVFLLVPCYVTVWYLVRAIMVSKAARPKLLAYLLTSIGSVPFWVFSVKWSQSIYNSLPNTPPNCFVVTAASKGHRFIVGPLMPTLRNHHCRQANHQLLTFWRFEELWRTNAPRSHASFRAVYNRFGPLVARHITNSLLADIVFLLLKPFEIVASMLIALWTAANESSLPACRNHHELH